jgi:hypothetical protein
MKKILKSVTIVSFLAFLPIVAFADVTFTGAGGQTCTGGGVGQVICQIQNLLNAIVPLLLALAVVYFVWGVVRFMIAGGEEAKTKGKDQIIYGIIGLAVIVGLWGLVNLVTNTFGLTGTSVNAPTLNVTTTAAGVGSTCAAPTNVQTLLGFATCIINNSIIPFIFALAIVMFIWGAVKFFIINADEEAKREQGKQYMIWGIIALAVMISVWGLVGILSNTFGLKANVLPQVCPPGATNCPSR